jgi:hypothetical protein
MHRTKSVRNDIRDVPRVFHDYQFAIRRETSVHFAQQFGS